MVRWRVFLTTAWDAIGLSHMGTARAAEQGPAPQPLEPLVWPLVGGAQPGIRTFAGHTNTVLDIVGRVGTPPSLVIYTEGNHLMVLLGKDIVGAFPAWARTQPQYAHLSLDNIVVVTMPQPIVVQMVRTGVIALGNLTLDVSRASHLFPDIAWAGRLRSGNCASSELSRRRLTISPEIAAARCSSARAIPSAFTALLTWRARVRASLRRIRSRPARAPAIAPRSKR
jgi:hypothetical protein